MAKVALLYDFDHTLSIEYQQMPILRKYAKGIAQKYGLTPEQYFPTLCGTRVAIGVGSLEQMIRDAKDVFPNLSNDVLEKEFGPQIALAPGLPEWFDRLNQYAQTLKLPPSHHVVSAGCIPLIKGTSCARYLDSIHAGEFLEENGKIDRIKTVVDPYSKTQWIKQICKGENRNVAENLTLSEYAVNYDSVILFADGFTDRDAINFIRERGGYTIGVYTPGNSAEFEKAKNALDGKVHFLVPRDYTRNSILEDVTLRALRRIADKKCDYYYMLVDGMLLGHLENSELKGLTKKHLGQCQDCQYRTRKTEVHAPLQC